MCERESVCVCLSVCERERGRVCVREREGVCVCLSVCVREREREREEFLLSFLSLHPNVVVAVEVGGTNNRKRR